MSTKNILPFLDSDDLVLLARRILKTEDMTFQDIRFEDILPYMDEDDIDNILSEEKANQKKSAINLSQDFCTKYFPKCRTRNEVESEILRLIRKLEIYEKGNTNQTVKEMAL